MVRRLDYKFMKEVKHPLAAQPGALRQNSGTLRGKRERKWSVNLAANIETAVWEPKKKKIARSRKPMRTSWMKPELPADILALYCQRKKKKKSKKVYKFFV